MTTPSHQEIIQALFRFREILDAADINEDDITPSELIEYFSGPAPSGDAITLSMVLSNPWLLVHEITELKILKSMGHTISEELLIEEQQNVLDAHILATEKELETALRFNARKWILSRIKDIRFWLEDEKTPLHIRQKCFDILLKYDANS